MKTLILSLLFAAFADGQTPGTVTVAASINATAGTLSCVGTATVGATVSTMQLKCTDGGATLIDYPFTVTAPGATAYSLVRGTNTIIWMLTKGNPTPDQWQVTATTPGGSKTGSGNF